MILAPKSIIDQSILEDIMHRIDVLRYLEGYMLDHAAVYKWLASMPPKRVDEIFDMVSRLMNSSA